MARRGSSVEELQKNRKKLQLTVETGAAVGRTRNSNQNKGKDDKKSTPSTKVKGRKLSPYEARQAERKAAMQDRARARHKAWKEERARKRKKSSSNKRTNDFHGNCR